MFTPSESGIELYSEELSAIDIGENVRAYFDVNSCEFVNSL